MQASDVHFPKDLSEALDIMRRMPGILVFAGGTDILREQGGRGIALPPDVLYIRDLPELRRAGLTERFLEIGAAVTVSELLELGDAALPPLLAEALRGIGSPALRNLANKILGRLWWCLQHEQHWDEAAAWPSVPLVVLAAAA